MTDLEALLSQAAHAPTTPAPDAVVDADLTRARRGLTHRRMRRTGTRSILAGALAIGVVAALPHGGSNGQATATKPLPAGQAKAALSGNLVAYTGAQPDGYTVDSVPSGWEIQGVNNFDLAIAPIGFADNSLDSFEGKLVVMLLSQDATPPTTGVPVDVGVTGTGRINRADGEGPVLTFKDAAGQWLDIQVPSTLNWSDAEIAAFGRAVHANASAQPGRG